MDKIVITDRLEGPRGFRENSEIPMLSPTDRPQGTEGFLPKSSSEVLAVKVPGL